MHETMLGLNLKINRQNPVHEYLRYRRERYVGIKEKEVEERRVDITGQLAYAV